MLGYCDIDPTRISIDSSKEKATFSDSRRGKGALLAKRLDGVRDDLISRIQLSQVYQIAALGMADMQENPCLPFVLGGVDYKPTFDNPLNAFMWMHLMKNEDAGRVYGSMTSECKMAYDTVMSKQP
jgi:hypothetical protein